MKNELPPIRVLGVTFGECWTALGIVILALIALELATGETAEIKSIGKGLGSGIAIFVLGLIELRSERYKPQR